MDTRAFEKCYTVSTDTMSAVVEKYGIQDIDDFIAALTAPIIEESAKEHDSFYMTHRWKTADMDENMDMAAYVWSRTHDAMMTFVAMNIMTSLSGDDKDFLDQIILSCDKRMFPMPYGSIHIVFYNTDFCPLQVVFEGSGGHEAGRIYQMLIQSVGYDKARLVLGTLGFAMVDKLFSAWNNLSSYYQRDLHMSGARLIDIAMMFAEEPHHMEWFVEFVRALRKDGEYQHMMLDFTVKQFLAWRDGGLLDLPVSFFMEMQNKGRDYYTTLSTLKSRCKNIFNQLSHDDDDDDMTDYSWDACFRLFDMKRKNFSLMNACVHDIDALPDDILKLMVSCIHDNNAATLGMFHIFSPIRDDNSYSMMNRCNNMRILRRVASYHDKDIWYRFMVFLEVGQYLKHEECMIYYTDTHDMMTIRRFSDIPEEAWDWIIHATVPDNLTYTYECGEANERIVDTKNFMSISDHVSSISLDGWKNIPTTYDGYMDTLYDDDDECIDSLYLMVLGMLHNGRQ